MQREIKERVRELRKNMTMAEKIFWNFVRRNQIENHKFLRQFPILFEYEGKRHFFVADFFCYRKKLIVEIDGKIHDTQKEADQFRTFLCEKLGFHVIRFTNEEVFSDLGGVLKKVRDELKR